MSYSPTEVQELQHKLRQSVLAQRSQLTTQEVQQKSGQVCQRFLDFIKQNSTAQDFEDQIIALYRCKSPTEGELDPSAILKSPLFGLAHFAFPRILSFADRTMDFTIPLHSSDWVIPKTQIPEPRSELPSINPESISLIVVPGVVFGLGGQRVGRGAGFYDRFLNQCPSAIRVGLAYDFQVSAELVDSVTASWDESLDLLVTEAQIFEF